MRTSNIELLFSHKTTATICSRCGNEYIIYTIHRNSENNEVISIWPQVGGYCYMCGKYVGGKNEMD